MTYTSKREGMYSYINHNLTVGIHVFSNNPVVNATEDPFTSHLVFFAFPTPSSNDMRYESTHRNDYSAHPLPSLFDNDLKTEWWFKGSDADVSLSYTNPL